MEEGGEDYHVELRKVAGTRIGSDVREYVYQIILRAEAEF